MAKWDSTNGPGSWLQVEERTWDPLRSAPAHGEGCRDGHFAAARLGQGAGRVEAEALVGS